MKEKELYDIFLGYKYGDIMDLFRKAKTYDEKTFYANISNMILAREQKKIIGEKWFR